MPKIYYKLSELTFQPKPLDCRFVDITNQKFHRLFVLGYAGKKGLANTWFVQCECGNITKVAGTSLKQGGSTSCGCYQRNVMNALSIHGATNSCEYVAYSTAKARCTNLRNPAFNDYGGRGIEFRFSSFQEFLTELGYKPTSKHSLDRIDVNGHYEKGNVRWATLTEQARNKRNSRFVIFNGIRRNLKELAEEMGLHYGTLKTRLKLKYCVPCALTLGWRQSCPHS